MIACYLEIGKIDLKDLKNQALIAKDSEKMRRIDDIYQWEMIKYKKPKEKSGMTKILTL